MAEWYFLTAELQSGYMLEPDPQGMNADPQS
jgi:hypothetical protein